MQSAHHNARNRMGQEPLGSTTFGVVTRWTEGAARRWGALSKVAGSETDTGSRYDGLLPGKMRSTGSRTTNARTAHQTASRVAALTRGSQRNAAHANRATAAVCQIVLRNTSRMVPLIFPLQRARCGCGAVLCG